MPKSRSKILIRNIRMELGEDAGYGISVELSDGQIIYCIRSALTQYNRYFPIRDIQSFRAPQGEYVYSPDPQIRGILDISIQDQTGSGTTFSPFTNTSVLLPGLGYGAGNRSMGLTAPRRYANYTEWKRGARETFSSMPGYFFHASNNNLYIYSPASSVLVTIHGAVDHDAAWDEEYMWEEETPGEPSPIHTERLDEALSGIPNGHMRWIRGGTVAKAKQILGRMLRKFDRIPTIDGESVSMDGGDLIREGKEEWDRVAEEIKNSEPEPAPILG